MDRKCFRILHIFQLGCLQHNIKSFMIKFKLPGGRRPWCCCHFNACPKSAKSLDDGTTDTSPANDWAIAILRFSFDVPSGYASRGSK